MKASLILPADEFEARRLRTQALMSERGLDGLVAFSGYAEREGHVCYLCNHHISFPNVLSHMGLGHAALLLPAEGKGTLVSPLGYEPNKVVGIDAAKTGFNLVGDLVAAVKERKLADRRIGIAGTDVMPAEYHAALIAALPGATLVDANDLLESQRLIKSQREIEILAAATAIADAGLEAGMAALRPGATQHEIELAARAAALRAGADYIPRVRVANGPKVSTLGWPMATDQTLAPGDLVYLDFIGWAGNYGFDNSRVGVVGKASDEQRDYLEHLLEATDWMIARLQPGAEVEFVFTESRGRSIMPFGHGIGLEICENPWIVASRRFTVQPGMVLCVEPMVNSAQFGSMAVEDAVLVTADGPRVLNQCPRRYW